MNMRFYWRERAYRTHNSVDKYLDDYWYQKKKKKKERDNLTIYNC